MPTTYTAYCARLRTSQERWTRQADGGLRICLEPPDIPLARRALAGLRADLNQGHVVFPGTDIPVQYELAGVQRSNREPNHGRP